MPPPNLEDVDDLCRFVLAARRLGCTVLLAGASDELRALVDLAGVTGILLDVRPSVDPDETDLR